MSIYRSTKFSPVISFPLSIPINASKVGATSAKRPFLRFSFPVK